MKRALLQCAAWVAWALGFYLGVLLLEACWNLLEWRPKMDAMGWAALFWVFLGIGAAWALSRQSQTRLPAVLSFLLCAFFAALGVYTLRSEPLSEGLLGRSTASPWWYRAARAGVLFLPLAFWIRSRRLSPCCWAGENYNRGMKHAGKARQAGLKLITASLVIVICMVAIWSYLAGRFVTPAAIVLGGIWLLFLIFSLNFFRDPEPSVPADARCFVSPAHGTVDVIDEAIEKAFMGGKCRRISIFLSVFDVHIQNSPVSGRVRLMKHSPGKFVNAMRSDCGECNENVLIGIESTEAPEERVAVKLIAGLLARRIVPWVAEGETVAKGERTSLIQFGSRVDLYLPLAVNVQVKLGQKVIGGSTIMATRV